MSDIMRRAQAYYDASYPPWIHEGTPGGPTITLLSPNVGVTGTQVTVEVDGTGFVAGSTVEVNGAALTTVFVSATELTADYTPATPGTKQFTVRNPDDSESNDAVFVVTDEPPTVAAQEETQPEPPPTEPPPTTDPPPAA
jgi:hypothetical protein